LIKQQELAAQTSKWWQKAMSKTIINSKCLNTSFRHQIINLIVEIRKKLILRLLNQKALKFLMQILELGKICLITNRLFSKTRLFQQVLLVLLDHKDLITVCLIKVMILMTLYQEERRTIKYLLERK
jgi:hypothetical protein